MDETEDLLRAKLIGETARLPWRELERHFARGAVIKAAPELDLVEVALAIALDRRAEVEAWMSGGQLGHASTEDALAWHDADATLWAVVTAPWVLVQDRPARMDA